MEDVGREQQIQHLKKGVSCLPDECRLKFILVSLQEPPTPPPLHNPDKFGPFSDQIRSNGSSDWFNTQR